MTYWRGIIKTTLLSYKLSFFFICVTYEQANYNIHIEYSIQIFYDITLDVSKVYTSIINKITSNTWYTNRILLKIIGLKT
jgi:hypothetical protein